MQFILEYVTLLHIGPSQVKAAIMQFIMKHMTLSHINPSQVSAPNP